MRAFTIIVSLIFVFIMFFTEFSISQELTDLEKAAIKARKTSVKRVPKIESLKNSRLVEERKDGYLNYRGDDEKIKKIVEDENYDRLLIYKFIAVKNGWDVEDVAERRAAMIKRDALKKCINSDNPVRCVPNDIKDKIKSMCQEKWGDDFRMQKHCVDEQAKSWIQLNN